MAVEYFSSDTHKDIFQRHVNICKQCQRARANTLVLAVDTANAGMLCSIGREYWEQWNLAVLEER